MPERMIEPLFGPYSGQRIAVSAVEAETAIAEGWARDPFQPAPPRAFSLEQHAALAASAQAAARRWRGEAEPEEPSASVEDTSDEKDAEGDDDEPPSDDASPSGRDLAPGPPGRYRTRAVAPKPAKRGRPAKR